MNKTKRGFMLASAIVNVVYTAIYAPFMLIALPVAIEVLTDAAVFGVTFSDVWGLLSIILLTVVFVASLIISCFLLPNPDKATKARNYFKLIITLIVLNFVILVLAAVSVDIFVILMAVVTIALYITTLCVHREENKTGVAVKTTTVAVNENGQPIKSAPQAPSIENELRAQFQGFDISNPTDRKIFRAKELLSKQIITDEEFKEILVEILSK